MRQQVANGGTGRAGGRVEVDGALLEGDVHGPGRQRLGHRGQLEHPPGIAMAGQHAARPDDGGGRGPDRPIGQHVEGRHHFRAM